MKRFFTQPQTLFVFFTLIFGIILIFLQPTGAGYDEETHFARIYEISYGHLIPNSFLESNGVPEPFYRISYRQKLFLTPIEWTQFKDSFQVNFDGPFNIGYRTRATYSPINYLPQALVVYVLGRGLNISLPIIYYIIRFTYLLSFTILGYFAIRFIPFGKWVLFVLMLAPTSFLQSSTITADATTFGVSFLFIAWSLHLIVDDVALSRKNFFITLFLIFLLASIKINSVPLILLLIFLKPAQFSSRKFFIIFWISSVFLLVIVAGGWNLIAWQSDSTRRGLEGISPFEVVLNSIKTPIAFIKNLILYIGSNFKSVISSWIATYGYGYWTVPGIVFIVYPLALLLTIMHDTSDKKIPLSMRFGLLGIFLLMFIGTFAIRFILKENMEGIVSTQGRYIITVMPLLFLGLITFKQSFPHTKWFKLISISLLILSSSFYLGGMSLSYYKLCGENTYNGQDCLLPVYKNWGPSTDIMVILPKDGTITQTFVSDCNKIDQINIQTLNLDPSKTEDTFSLSIQNKENDQVIAQQDFLIKEIPLNGTLTINFSALKNVANREFLIQIQSLSTSGDSLGVPVFDPGEYNGPHSFSINGEIQDKDIYFHYRCVN